MNARILTQLAHTVGLRTVTLVCRLALIFLLGHAFSPADYGAYSLITVVVTFGTLLFGLNLYAYVYRAVPGRPEAEQLRISRSTLTFEASSATLVAVALLLSGQMPAALTLFKASDYETSFAIGLVLVVALTVSAELAYYLNARAEIQHSNWMDFLSQASWIVPLFAIRLMGGHITLELVLLANLLGVALAIAYGFRRVGLRAWWRTAPSWSTIMASARFSVPMILPGISFYVLKLADRFFLSYFWSLHEVGIYSFAYNFLNTLYAFTAWVVFNTFSPYLYAAHNQGRLDERDSLQTYMTKLAAGLFLLGFGALVLCSPTVVGLMARPEYLPAVDVMPWLGLGYLIMILTAPAKNLLTLQDRVLTIMLIDLAGMVVGLLGNLLLVPRFAYYGAAVSSILGLGLVFALASGSTRIWESVHFRALFTLERELVYAERGARYVMGRIRRPRVVQAVEPSQEQR